MRTEARYRILILLAVRSEQHVSCECVWRDAVTAAAWFKDFASDREWKRMAATSMRMPGKHQAPLKTLNRGNNFYRAHRAANTAKRKSAVELLQETKAFYVKSETVLDRKQELKNSGHLQVTSSAVDTVFLRGPLLKKSASGPTAWLNHVHGNPGSRPEQDKYVHQHVLVLSTPQAPPAVPPRANPLQPSSQQTPPPLPPKSPRLIPAAQRRSGSNPNGDQLQTKLRRLLNADSKENLYQRLLDNDDQDVKTVAGDEKPYAACHQYGRSISHIQHGPPPPPACKVHHKSLPDLHSSPTRTAVKFSGDTSSNTSSSSSTSSSTSTSSSGRCRRSVGSAPGTTLSSASHRSQPNLSSPRVGTMRCFTRLSSGGSSPVRELENDVQPNSTSSYSDSGAEDANSSACRDDDNWHRERRRPILRSKSDISHRYSVAPKPSPVPQPRSAAQLDKFFEQLGLEAGDFRSLSAPASGSSSPVFFESVSSVDSGTNPWGGTGGGSGGSSNFHRSSEQLSIVERNARIIKWLCNCRKAHLASRKSS